MAISQKNQLVVTLAAAGLVAVAVGAYAFWGVFEAERKDEAREEVEARLFALEAESIASLQLHANGETTSLDRADGAWRITAPVEAAADTGAVDALIARLVAAKRKKLLVESGADLTLFGLDEPTIRISASTADGQEASLAIGAQNTFDSSYFVSPGQGQVASADASIKTALEKGTFDLRDKRVIVFGDDGLESISTTGTASWTLRRSDGSWTLAGDQGGPADEKIVGGILRALHDLRALSFPAGTAADHGLDPPSIELTLRREDLPPLVLRLGSAEDKHYASFDGGAIMEIPGSLFTELVKEPKELLAPPPAPEGESPEGVATQGSEPAEDGAPSEQGLR